MVVDIFSPRFAKMQLYNDNGAGRNQTMAERRARRTSPERADAAATRAPRLPPAALTFLRALKRHNDREWFRPRKDHYELMIRAPMVQIIERLAADFRTIAP